MKYVLRFLGWIVLVLIGGTLDYGLWQTFPAFRPFFLVTGALAALAALLMLLIYFAYLWDTYITAPAAPPAAQTKK
jgi:hypothetical protein